MRLFKRFLVNNYEFQHFWKHFETCKSQNLDELDEVLYGKHKVLHGYDESPKTVFSY